MGNDAIASVGVDKLSAVKYFDSMKIGRNDPCPCGSGKKYKKCCLEKDENARRLENQTGFRGVPPVTNAPVGDVVNSLDLENRLADAKDIDDVRSRMGTIVDEYNAKIDEDDIVIDRTADRLNELYEKGPLNAESAVTVNKKVSASVLEKTPVVVFLRVFLEILARNGGNIPLDDSGFLKVEKKEFTDLFVEWSTAQFDGQNKLITSLFSDYLPVANVIALEIGLIKPEGDRVSITEKGIRLLAGKELKKNYFSALTAMTNRISWFFGLDYPDEAGIIQDVSGIALFFFSVLENDEKNALPDAVLDTIDSIIPVYRTMEKAGFSPEETQAIFFDNFFLLYCFLFGFIDVIRFVTEKEAISFQKGALLNKIFQWQV